MKRALLLPLLGAAVAMVSSCGNLATSLNSKNFDPGTNPLDSPGKLRPSDLVEAGPRFAPGSWVEVTDSNAGFYRRVPKRDEQADYRLKLATPLKVVGGEGSYVKVETESGQIGYVPAIMVGTKPVGRELPLVSPQPAAAPPSIEPIDTIDPITPIQPLPSTPEPLGAGDLPFVAPEPEVPPISVEESPPAPAPSPVVPAPAPRPVAPAPAPAPSPVVPPDPLEEGEEDEEDEADGSVNSGGSDKPADGEVKVP